MLIFTLSQLASAQTPVGLNDFVPLETVCASYQLPPDCTLTQLDDAGLLDDHPLFAAGDIDEGPPLYSLGPDPAALDAAIAAYEQLVGDELALPGPDDVDPQIPGDPDLVDAVVVPDGQGGRRQTFSTDDRVPEPEPYAYPEDKHVLVVLGRPTVPTTASTCSGTFIDARHVLTAAHCVNDEDNGWEYTDDGGNIVFDRPATRETEHGRDFGRGYVCSNNGGMNEPAGYRFQDECEFVRSRFISGRWLRQRTATDRSAADYAVLRLQTVTHPSGLGQGRWMSISRLRNARDYESKVPINRGYPGANPDMTANRGQANYVEAGTGWGVFGREQLWNQGAGVVSVLTTDQVIRTTVDGSSGQSGSAFFYYTDDGTHYTGQGHHIIGLFTQLSNSRERNVGPTARRFRRFALGLL